jgi:hypothetical protein
MIDHILIRYTEFEVWANLNASGAAKGRIIPFQYTQWGDVLCIAAWVLLNAYATARLDDPHIRHYFE